MQEAQMGETSLYDDDVYAWSEQQAAALRRLANRHDLPNDLDLLHVAEEIEDVGASQLRAVRSLIRLILTHAIKCWADPEAPSALHWAAEIRNWHNDLADRLTPAMAVKIDMTDLWRRAAEQADADLLAYGREAARARLRQGLTEASCPIALDDLTDDAMTAEGLVKRIVAGVAHRG
jgi:hypothetical protein